jgi:hypothetical protein
MSITATTLELRTTPNFIQIDGDDGVYEVQSGFAIQGRESRLRGDAIFELQGVFKTQAAADQKIEQLCGDFSNGFCVSVDDIDNSAEWLFIGADY